MKETDFVDCSKSIVTDTKSDQSYQMIKGIVVDLRQVVDQIECKIDEIRRKIDAVVVGIEPSANNNNHGRGSSVKPNDISSLNGRRGGCFKSN